MSEEGTASSPASWAELPLEILDQILVLCDTPTLLSLGKLNHTLNRLALEQLFKCENVTNPKQGYVVSRLAPKEVVPALNAALWIKHLPHITYYLNPDVNRLFNEVKGIANFMARMPTNDRLDLYFSSVDRWFADLVISRMEGQVAHVPAIAWRNIFIALLETALRKGCKAMRVEGGHRLEASYVGHPPSKEIVPDTATSVNSVTPPPVSNLEEVSGTAINQTSTPLAPISIPKPDGNKRTLGLMLFFWLKKRLGLQGPKSLLPTPTTVPVTIPQVLQPSVPEPRPASPTPLRNQPILKPEADVPDETAVTSFATTSPSLTTLNLRSSMMMQPLFFPHTINLIQNHSAVLRHLEVVSIKVGAPVWETFFTSLTLPVLQNFIYLYDTLIVEVPFLTPRLLLDFFTRHPKLRNIELYGVSTTSDFPQVDPNLLPNLKSLNAHPRIVSWLLYHPTSCPHLSFVSLTSEYLATRLSMIPDLSTGPYSTFDLGIMTIASLDRPLHVQFKFSTERDLCAWFATHITAGTTKTSPVQRLTKVTKFTISSHYHTRFDHNVMEVIPQWLKLFPKLKTLEMIELPYPEELKDETFVKAVKKAVPGLQSWLVGRDRVF